jgi:hypothetical protein
MIYHISSVSQSGDDCPQHLVWANVSSPSATSSCSSSSQRDKTQQVQADIRAGLVEASNQASNGVAWSVGSALHDERDCTPCALDWRPSGCSHGESCQFCHLCGKDTPVGRLKLKKNKKAAAAATAAAANAALQPGLVPGSGTGTFLEPSQPAAASANVPSRPAVRQPVQQAPSRSRSQAQASVLPGAGTGPQPRKKNSGQIDRSAVSSAQASQLPLQKFSL